MPSVPTTPQPGKIASETDAPAENVTDLAQKDRADAQGVDTIRQYTQDIDDLRSKEKAGKERLEEIEASWEETSQIDELSEQLRKLRERLKSRRLTNTQYLNQTEKVAKVKRDLKEAREILSTYLVFHYRKTGETQVLMDEDNGDAREVVLKAKLGRLTKYQTSMDLEPAE